MKKYVRKIIKELEPYKVVEEEYRIKLDANEGIEWLDGLNRYPNDSADEVKNKISEWINKSINEIIMGNGSSELIEMVLKTFLEPNEAVVGFSPSFSMYEIFTKIYNGKYVAFELDNTFKLCIDGFIEFINRIKPKIVLISNPNNPTGIGIALTNIIQIVEQSDAIIVVDEAYIEFGGESSIEYINKYNNLIILRTFSKAMGLAGIRLGYMVANEELISYVKRIKSPYNVNKMTQEIGINALLNLEVIEKNIELIKNERSWLFQQLEELKLNPIISESNFILFKSNICDDLYEFLKKEGILIRKFSDRLEGYCRITVGTKEENREIINKIRSVYYENSNYK
jgi:histidinol-phosphate aminotransferase